MIKLRPGQREVALYRGGYLAVPAVPGAGKTTVLAHLAAEMIAEEVHRPGKILVVTVMNSAVANFRRRIGDFLVDRGLPRSKGYDVKTLHSLAMTILKEKPEFLLINQNFQILDEGNQHQIIKRITKEWLANNQGLWQECIKFGEKHPGYQKALAKWEDKDLPNIFRGALGCIKGAALTPDHITELQRHLDPDNYLAWALEVYQSYNQELINNCFLDFDDLIVQAVRLLKEEPDVLERLQRRWTFFFEDEAQDSNPLQEEILMLLSAKSGNLVRVGDSNQAILGTFTSAEPEIFRGFCQGSGVAKESILYSSRSSTQIINLANHLVDWVNNHHPQGECCTALENQHILPVNFPGHKPNPTTNGYTISIRAYETPAEEVESVARMAADYVRRNPTDTAAILVPNRFVQEEFAKALEAINAPFEEVGKVTNQQAKTIIDVKLTINYLAEPHHDHNLVLVLNNLFIPELDHQGRQSLGELFKRYPIEQVIYPVGGELPWLEIPDELAQPEIYTAFLNGLKTIQRWLEASIKLPPDELVLFLGDDLKLDPEQLGIAHNLALLIKQKMYQHPQWRLFDIAKEIPAMESSVKSFIKTINDQQGFQPTQGVISLLTAHKSKGLEWGTVYLTGVTGEEYPSTLNDKFRSEMYYLKEDKCNPMALIKAELKMHRGQRVVQPLEGAKIDDICERLRLLYVAITRAEKNLLFSYTNKNAFKGRVKPSGALIALGEFMAKERAAHDQA